MADERENLVLSYATPDDEVWTPPDSVHVLLGSAVYALAFVALAALSARSYGWRHAMLPSAVLALFTAAAGAFLFLPPRWSWRRVMLGAMLAGGVALLASIGFAFP